jgi:hypothetical protein
MIARIDVDEEPEAEAVDVREELDQRTRARRRLQPARVISRPSWVVGITVVGLNRASARSSTTAIVTISARIPQIA